MKKDIYLLVKELPTGVEFTAQELIEKYGFTKYYLEKAKKMGLLENPIKGKYYKINYFNRLNRKILNGKIEEAYELLKKAILTRDDNNHDNDYRICLILLEKYLNITKSEIDSESILEFTEDDCSFESGYENFIDFREYVMSSDWEKALESIAKFSRYEKDRDGCYGYLSQVYYRLVYEIVFEENTKLDSDIISELVNAKEYNKLFNILSDFGVENLNSNYLKLFNCLKYFVNLSKSKPVNTKKIDENKNLDSAKNRFFEMMKCGRYKEALAALKEVNRDKISFYDEYMVIINDILKLEENKRFQDEVNRTFKQLNSTHIVDWRFIIKLLDEKIQYCREYLDDDCFGVDISYDERAKSLTEVFGLALCNKIDLSYFQEFKYEDGKVLYSELDLDGNLTSSVVEGMSYDKDDIISKFILALNLGDYLTAFDCALSPGFNEAAKVHPKKKYLYFYKTILFKIKKCCEKNKTRYEHLGVVGNQLDTMSLAMINDLNYYQMLDLILASEKGNIDYMEAFDIYSDNLSDVMFQDSPETKLLFEKILSDLSRKQETKIMDSYKAYKKYKYDKNYELAKESLDELSMLSEGTCMETCSDYRYEELNNLSLEMNSENAEKSSFLYKKAWTHFKNGNYWDCINTLNKYIDLNPELAISCYCLMGMAYENLNDLEMAEKCYRLTLEKSHLEEAYLKLGNICFYSGRYRETLDYYLEFKKRKPLFFIPALVPLVKVYEKLRDNENRDKYKKILERAIHKKDKRSIN